MASVLFEDKNFKVIHSRDFIVIRKNHEYSFHSHFKKYDGAMGLIHLFYKKVLPTDEYFNTAMKRITTEEEFKRLTT